MNIFLESKAPHATWNRPKAGQDIVIGGHEEDRKALVAVSSSFISDPGVAAVSKPQSSWNRKDEGSADICLIRDRLREPPMGSFY